MRIISGTKRGLKLLPPKSRDTRPITDRVKESLFSVLYKYDLIEDGYVADLFCGTGSTGLEALSRGAKWCVFIEQSRGVTEILQKNIERAGFVEKSKILKSNAFKTGAPPDFEDHKYSLVFVDPPYKMAYDTGQESQLGKLLRMLCEQITPEGIVSVRTSKDAMLEDAYDRLVIIDRRVWGNMAVTLLQLEKGND
ncbi:MAG: 16S rRNA (guanine(966)-N(2))-methyltransferase RsmD [Sedimentisphaerales bacterium]|nr:16S rRNA (guanine(966)-N(2))-methyltransferase RsmD [Sedimentisphaerales bacterium]